MTSSVRLVVAVAAAVLCLAASASGASIWARNSTVMWPKSKPRVNEITINEKGEKITPFMRKHGLTPTHGWGLKAGLLSGFEYPNGTFQANNNKLTGFFVMPCQYRGQTYDGKDISSFQTRHYHEDDYTYEIDTTFYIGDKDCTPLNSDIYYKTYFHGTVAYHGANQVIPNAQMAELDWTDGMYYFANNPWGRYLVASLNKDCPCGGTWQVDTFRNVSASQCEQKTSSTNYLCQIITGQPEYFNYQWTDDTHYITSADCFTSKTDCYNQPLNPSYIREKIPESGNQDPAGCTYVEWAKCQAGIQLAQQNCETCVGLECDGCLFRELNPNWNPTSPSSDYNDWYECCPCIYAYAEQYDKDWMTTLC